MTVPFNIYKNITNPDETLYFRLQWPDGHVEKVAIPIKDIMYFFAAEKYMQIGVSTGFFYKTQLDAEALNAHLAFAEFDRIVKITMNGEVSESEPTKVYINPKHVLVMGGYYPVIVDMADRATQIYINTSYGNVYDKLWHEEWHDKQP